jgi:hypothetical protein
MSTHSVTTQKRTWQSRSVQSNWWDHVTPPLWLLNLIFDPHTHGAQ